MEISVAEFWEKSLGFLQLDYAAVEYLGDSEVTLHFMTMYGEVYWQTEMPSLDNARVFLRHCEFELFEPTPRRLIYREPRQIRHFVLADLQQPERIYARESEPPQ